MQPSPDQVEFPIVGVEPHEIETQLPPMRDYSSMRAFHFTDPTARWTQSARSSVIFNPVGPWRRES